MNKRSIMVSSLPATGKTFSLRNLPLEKVLYLGIDGKDDLDFDMQNKFGKFIIPEDPLQVIQSLEAFEESEFEYIVVDSLSFWFEQIESMHIINAEDTRAMWGMYAQWGKELLNFARLKSKKTWIFFVHTDEEAKGKKKGMVKGSLSRLGLESFFSVVLEGYTYDLAEPNIFGSVIGYGFQTKPTLDNRNTNARSPIGLFPERIKNNDLDLVLRRLSGEKIDWDNDEVIFAKDRELAEKLGI